MISALCKTRSLLCFCCVVIFAAICVAMPRPASALEPPRPGEIERLKREGKFPALVAAAEARGNHRIDPGLLEQAIYKAKFKACLQRGMSPSMLPAPPPSARLMPTRGDVRTFALVIDFLDYPAYDTNPAQPIVNSALYGDGSLGGNPYPYESLANFYKRSSYNQLDLSHGVTLGVYHSGINKADVPQTDEGRENLIKTAITALHGSVDFSQFDNDGNGQIEYFIVIWTGPPGDWSTFWWGYQATWDNTRTPFTIDGKTLGKYSWQWEYDYQGVHTGHYDPRVVIHETGHALGLPDYYDYDSTVGTSGGIGSLDIMDGVWGDHNCFSKWVLDWINPTVVAAGSQTITLNPSGTSPDAVVIMPGATGTDAFREFFIAQNRYRVGNDPATTISPRVDGYSASRYPTDGMLIWHVDARLNGAGTDYAWDNSYTAHKLIKLMQADGLDRIENLSATADAAMYYKPGASLGPLTAPDSRDYLGADTGVNVTGISQSWPTMTATFSIDSPHVLPTLTVAKAGTGSGTVTSNPAGISFGTDNMQSYPSGTDVTLSAVPAPGCVLTGWTGGSAGSCPGTCTVHLTTDTTVTASFDSTAVLSQDFSGGSLPAGWSKVISAGAAWWWFNYTDNKTGGLTNYALGATYGDGPFDLALMTPAVSMAAYNSVGLEFKADIGGDSNSKADVDVSTDGGSTWTNAWEKVGRSSGPQTIDVDVTALAAGHSNVKIRFRTYGNSVWFAIDDVKVLAATRSAYPTTAVVTSDTNPSLVDGLVTFTATASPSCATGTATFNDGSTTLWAGPLVNGTACFSTSSLAAGSHSITVVYGGDAYYGGSTSPAITQRVYQPRTYAISNKAACDKVLATFSELFQFKLYGKASNVGPTSFTLDDGSGKPLPVDFLGSPGIANGDMVTVLGTLTQDAGSVTLYAPSSGIVKIH